jgi:hypothetical protein
VREEFVVAGVVRTVVADGAEHLSPELVPQGRVRWGRHRGEREGNKEQWGTDFAHDDGVGLC